jgi:hypothetical protein
LTRRELIATIVFVAVARRAAVQPKMKRWILTAALGFLVFCGKTRATTFLEVESAYLGDGWFSYRVKVCNDPFVWQAGLGSFGLMVTNFIENGAPPNEWTNSTAAGSGSWNYALTNWWQDRPYERTFYARSSERTYRFNTYGCIVTFSLWPRNIADGQWSFMSANVVGYAMLPCLVPCSPDQADGSPSDYLYNWKLVPDIQMGPLVLTNDTPFGITYDWPASGLVELQGSFDLQTWTLITRINGTSGRTTWTTNTPINTLGSNFRVQLISGDLFGNALPTKQQIVSNLRCIPGAHTVTINFDATTDGPYIVYALTMKRQIVGTTTTTVTAGKGTATFQSDTLPNPVTFTAAPQ